MAWLWSDQHLMAVLLLVGGVLAMLLGVLTTGEAALGRANTSPRRRAIVHWLPIAVAAIVSTLLGHSEIGIGITFGTSVAALSAVAGFVALAGSSDEPPPSAARMWAFLPVTALLAFVIGFRASVGLFEAAVLLIQGALLAMVWPRHLISPMSLAQARLFPASNGGAAGRPGRLMRLLQAAAALGLIAVGAWASTRGAVDLSRHDVRYSTNMIASTLLSVTLAMPLIAMGVPLAAEGRTWIPLTAQVGLVYLNLCLLLPILILLALLVGNFHSIVAAASTAPAATEWTAVLYPRITWRIDALFTLILSICFIPISAGRLKLDHRVAGWLIVGYGLYLVAVIAAGMQF